VVCTGILTVPLASGGKRGLGRFAVGSVQEKGGASDTWDHMGESVSARRGGGSSLRLKRARAGGGGGVFHSRGLLVLGAGCGCTRKGLRRLWQKRP